MKKSAIAVAAVMAAATGAAHATMLNWQLDPDGAAGPAGRVTVSEYLDIGNSISYVSSAAPSGGGFTFSENGAALFTGHDAASFGSFNGQLTSTYMINGTGQLGGNISYSGGTINVYSGPAGQYSTATGTYGANSGTLIGTFGVTGGNGMIDLSGQPNGMQTLQIVARNLAQGYWFDTAGMDLSTSPSGAVLGLVTTNASRLSNPNSTAQAALGPTVLTNCLPGQTGGACTGVGSFFLSNNGQFRLDVAAIPEPSTSALLLGGVAMLGFIAFRRGRKQA